MDKATIAESILSLAMEPTQAGIVTGDLIEAGVSHHPAWFWSNVFQTLLAAAWRDTQKQPSFVLRLAVTGVLMQFAITTGIRTLMCIFVFWLPYDPPLALLCLLCLLSYFLDLIIAFCSGQWIARRSSGKDFAVCAAMVFFLPFVRSECLVLSSWAIVHTHFFSPTVVTGYVTAAHTNFFQGWGWWDIVILFACWLGAAQVHLRQQIRSSPAD